MTKKKNRHSAKTSVKTRSAAARKSRQKRGKVQRLLTKREFAALCGVNTRYLSVYIRSGKIELTADDLINPAADVNAAFLATRTGTPAAAPAASGQPKLVDVLREKAAAQLAKIQLETEILAQRKTKYANGVLPIEFASFLINNYSVGITNVWLTATDRFLMQKATALGLSREEMIQHKKYIHEIVNDATKKGAETANKNALKAAREYAGKKERGEKHG